MAPTSDERRDVTAMMRDVTDTELYVMYLDEILCGILGDRCCRGCSGRRWRGGVADDADDARRGPRDATGEPWMG